MQLLTTRKPHAQLLVKVNSLPAEPRTKEEGEPALSHDSEPVPMHGALQVVGGAPWPDTSAPKPSKRARERQKGLREMDGTGSNGQGWKYK